MKISFRINSVLALVVLILVLCGYIFLAYYSSVQNKVQIKNTEKHMLDNIGSHYEELITDLILDQTSAVDLYLSYIKKRDGMEQAMIIEDDRAASIVGSLNCSRLDNQISCADQNKTSLTLLVKLSYGDRNFGYLYLEKKTINSNRLLNTIGGNVFIIIVSIAILLFTIIAMLAMMLNKMVSKPIMRICDEMKPLANGKYNIKFSDYKTYEFQFFTNTINKIVKELHYTHQKIKKNTHLAAIGQSTAMVAHDVRKPLSSMKALLLTLPALKDDPEQIKKMMAAVDRNITQTNALLNDIMEFSRDSTTLDLANHNPQGVITASLGDALRNHPDSSIAISYKFGHQYTAICADSARLIRVLTNIMDNAIGAMTSKETGKAIGNLSIETYECKKDDKTYVGITIEDNGPGIPAESLNKIFDPFFTQGKKGGTGLGLAICQRIINLHGGTITAANNENDKGARFTIELPAGEGRVGLNENELIHNSDELKLFREEEACRVDYGDTSNISEFLKLNKERGRVSYLMIVDDEPLFRETLRNMIEEVKEVRDHVRIVETGSAEEALNLFNAREFDYVIADIDLGTAHMNGYEFAQHIMKKYSNTYVLIHSNKRKGELDKNIRGVASDKFLGFLPKPMQKAEIIQLLACKTFEVKMPNTIDAKQRKSVLLLNDDDDFNISMKFILKSDNIQVIAANNVSDALSKFAQKGADVILSDINLGSGEKDGYEFLKEVRSKDAKIPFYFVSGFSESDIWPKAKPMGATGYLQIPVEKETLLNLLKNT